MICKVLVVDPACAIRLSRRKVLFSGLKFINMTLLNYGSRENSQICPSTPVPHFKRGGHRPPHFENCSAGPVLKLLARDVCNIFFICLATFTASFIGFPQSWFSIFCNCPAENVLPFLGFAGMHFVSSSHIFVFRPTKNVLPIIGFGGIYELEFPMLLPCWERIAFS